MISKIAIFRALQLGDMLCIIPTVRAVRAAYPNATISLIGLASQRDFAMRFSCYFNHFIEFPGWPGLPEQEADPQRILPFLQKMRSFEFDLVLQMQGNGEITNSLCMLWGASHVCGLRKQGEYAPNETMFPVSEDTDHEVTRFLKLLTALKIEPKGIGLEFPLCDDEIGKAHNFLSHTGLTTQAFVCIHPGARDVRRRWPVQNFAFIANRLVSMGVPVVLTGSGEEAPLLRQLQERIDGPVVNLVESLGHVPAGQLGALIARAALLVSNDTGVSHMATALKTPSVVIFSPFSDFNRWRPLESERNIGIPHELASDSKFVFTKVQEVLTMQQSPHRQLTQSLK